MQTWGKNAEERENRREVQGKAGELGWALHSRFKGSVEMLMLVGRQKGAVLVLE